MNTVPRVVAICGPTASGKSDLAIQLARTLGGEVIGVDSVQVYRGADIGSAKVSPHEASAIPHHLIDVFDPDQVCNAAAFRDRALRAIEDVRSKGSLPILAVGTTMYFTTLVHGIAEIPKTDDVLRAELDALESADLHLRLQQVDPARAQVLNINDRVRIIRALESFERSGRTQSELHAGHAFRDNSLTGVFIVLVRQRDDLYRRIDARSQKLVDSGLLQETKSLMERYGENIPALSAIGYREAVRVLKGELPREALAETIAQATRRYAKRQMTFWRNEPAKRGWATLPEVGDSEAVEVGKEGITGRRSNEQARGFQVLPMEPDLLEARLQQRLASHEFLTPEVWYVMPVSALDSGFKPVQTP